MIKLMIVEDEETIREGIVNTIHWETFGVKICGQADNGQSALALMHEVTPDILLTDIRMPKMDGLELIEKANEAGMQFKAILLSGFNEFNYAKQGIKLGAVDYILKPCRPEDILNAVLNTKQLIEEQRHMDRSVDELQTWRKNAPLAKWHVLSLWMNNPKTPLEDRYAMIEELRMAIEPNSIHIGLVRIEELPSHKRYTEGDRELLRYATLNIMQESLTDIYKGKLEVFRDANDLLWCGNVNLSLSHAVLKKHILTLQHNLEHYLGITVSIGVGDPCPTINELHQSYQEANAALERKFFAGKGGIYFYKQPEENERQDSEASELICNELHSLKDQLMQAFRQGQYAEALDLTEQWLMILRKFGARHRQDINKKASEFIIELQILANEHKTATIDWKNHVINWIEQMPNFETFDDLYVVIKKIVQNLISMFTSQTSVHRTVQLAMDIIHERYATNLTLDSIAREVFVSNTYLSTLFKQELGVNFLDYLHQYRVEQAKILLAQNYRVFAVSKMVGYQDERHFSNTFKKWTGLTPSQYRELNNQGKAVSLSFTEKSKLLP